MDDAVRREMFRRLAEADPEPTTELVYASPFQLLISVILSARSGLNRGCTSAPLESLIVVGRPRSSRSIDCVRRPRLTVVTVGSLALHVLRTLPSWS